MEPEGICYPLDWLAMKRRPGDLRVPDLSAELRVQILISEVPSWVATWSVCITIEAVIGWCMQSGWWCDRVHDSTAFSVCTYSSCLSVKCIYKLPIISAMTADSNSLIWACAKRPHSLRLITSEREARSEFLLIYTKNLSMSGRPAGRPAVVTLLRGLYLWNRKPDW